MRTKYQLCIFDGVVLIYVKTFETMKEVVLFYVRNLYEKYALDNYSIYYRKEKFLS